MPILTPNTPRSFNELRAAQFAAKLNHVGKRLFRFNLDVKAGLPVGPDNHWKTLSAAQGELAAIVGALQTVLDELRADSSLIEPPRKAAPEDGNRGYFGNQS